MAKGVEDTAFYRYHGSTSLNEVGGDPAVFVVDRRRVPRAMRASASASWPAAMTTLSTHDTKRSEDVRARLAVLAEMPERLGAALDRLLDAGARCRDPASATCSGRRSSALAGRSRGAAARLRREGDARGRRLAPRWTDPDAALRGGRARGRRRGLRRRRV